MTFKILLWKVFVLYMKLLIAYILPEDYKSHSLFKFIGIVLYAYALKFLFPCLETPVVYLWPFFLQLLSSSKTKCWNYIWIPLFFCFLSIPVSPCFGFSLRLLCPPPAPIRIVLYVCWMCFWVQRWRSLTCYKMWCWNFWYVYLLLNNQNIVIARLSGIILLIFF